MYGKVEGGGARGEARDVSCACGVCLPELPELCVCVSLYSAGEAWEGFYVDRIESYERN